LPGAGAGATPVVITGDSQIERMTTGNEVDLGNEVAGLIAQVKAKNASLSNDAIADALIAAYCPVVARKAGASPPKKWRLMRQFDRVLMQQLAATTLPQGSLIIANVPLPPAVYQALRAQAKAAGQTAAELMAAILTRAAGQ
jgi:hypothetical protein